MWVSRGLVAGVCRIVGLSCYMYECEGIWLAHHPIWYKKTTRGKALGQIRLHLYANTQQQHYYVITIKMFFLTIKVLTSTYHVKTKKVISMRHVGLWKENSSQYVVIMWKISSYSTTWKGFCKNKKSFSLEQGVRAAAIHCRKIGENKRRTLKFGPPSSVWV